MDLRQLYQRRFSQYERVRRKILWQTLVSEYLQQFVDQNDVVVDVGAGSCEFINTISAHKKIALDINPDTQKHAARKVRVIKGSVVDIKVVLKGQRITVFL